MSLRLVFYDLDVPTSVLHGPRPPSVPLRFWQDKSHPMLQAFLWEAIGYLRLLHKLLSDCVFNKLKNIGKLAGEKG